MTDNKIKKRNVMFFSGLFLALIAIVLVFLFIFNGTTTFVSGGVDVENEISVSCTGNDYSYPFFTFDSSSGRDIKINALFDGEKLETIMLTYSMTYPNSSLAEESRNINHAAMNDAFRKDSLSSDYFDARYSLFDNTFQLTLYARKNMLNGITSKYFLLGETRGTLKKDTVTKALNNSGLDCVVQQ